jgi:hypothetical protein
VQAYDGTGAWKINPFQGRKDAERMSADEARQFADEGLVEGALLASRSAGSQVQYLGREDFAGTLAYKLRVKQKLGVHDESLQSTYLGMPTRVGRSPTSNFNFLTGRLWKRLNGCTDRPLSRAGKEIFLKSVAQAIPTYVMSCFRIPISICEKLQRPISNFWWGA